MWCGMTADQLFLRQCNVLNSFSLCSCPLWCIVPSALLWRWPDLPYQTAVCHRDKCAEIYCRDPLCLPWPGSTHLRDPRTTSNPSSPSSSPLTPSALGSGVSDPVLNGGLCSAAFCSSAGGKFSQNKRVTAKERASKRDGPLPENTGDPGEATME